MGQHQEAVTARSDVPQSSRVPQEARAPRGRLSVAATAGMGKIKPRRVWIRVLGRASSSGNQTTQAPRHLPSWKRHLLTPGRHAKGGRGPQEWRGLRERGF